VSIFRALKFEIITYIFYWHCGNQLYSSNCCSTTLVPFFLLNYWQRVHNLFWHYTRVLQRLSFWCEAVTLFIYNWTAAINLWNALQLMMWNVNQVFYFLSGLEIFFFQWFSRQMSFKQSYSRHWYVSQSNHAKYNKEDWRMLNRKVHFYFWRILWSSTILFLGWSLWSKS